MDKLKLEPFIELEGDDARLTVHKKPNFYSIFVEAKEDVCIDKGIGILLCENEVKRLVHFINSFKG
jgi:hypothetical protein